MATKASIEIGKRLRALRKEKGVTQAEAAIELGVGRSCISNWEAGLREPGFEWWEKLSEYFDVSVNYLFAGQKQKEAEPFDLECLNTEGRELLKQFYLFLTGLPQYRKNTEDIQN